VSEWFFKGPQYTGRRVTCRICGKQFDFDIDNPCGHYYGETSPVAQPTIYRQPPERWTSLDAAAADNWRNLVEALGYAPADTWQGVRDGILSLRHEAAVCRAQNDCLHACLAGAR
jgi:hypothetical protein